jgi:hypothetical protein
MCSAPRHTPEDVTIRIRLLLESETYTAPLESTDTPDGPLKEAAVPKASAQAAVPDPANVDTTPAHTIQHFVIHNMQVQ